MAINYGLTVMTLVALRVYSLFVSRICVYISNFILLCFSSQFYFIYNVLEVNFTI